MHDCHIEDILQGDGGKGRNQCNLICGHAEIYCTCTQLWHINV